MWSPDRLFRAAALGLALIALPAASACTMAPVHSTGTERLAIAIADPGNRLEQIAYRSLTQRLSFSGAENAPRLDLRVRTSAARMGLSDVDRPLDERQMTATITYTVTDAEGEVLAQGTRAAGTTYDNSSQALAADASRTAAQERAVAAAAEAVRLALLARFSAP